MSENVENELVRASFGEAAGPAAPKPRPPRARRSDAGAPRSGLALVKLVQASRLPVPDGCLEKAQLDELVALRAGAERVAVAVAEEVKARAEKLRVLGAP